MPGIAGIITKQPRAWSEQRLLQMVEVLKHETFYRTGTWIDEALGVYVGWTVIADSFADGMPLHHPGTGTTLVFSGEDYRPSATGRKDELNGNHHSHTPSSYLAQVAETPSFPGCLNGIFHGLLANPRSREVTLFNDRYGMHRLYIHESRDAFYFACEAKAILAIMPELRTASPQGLGEFLACSCVLENRTIFKDISVLPAGSIWKFRNAALERKDFYFKPEEWEKQTPLDSEAYYQQLEGALSDCLPAYFSGPQAVGIALTGGMDTRVILAQKSLDAGSIPCYTFGGMFRDCQDVRLARKVAAACEQTHQVIPVAEEFLKNFARYAERTIYLTEGGVDVYRSSDLYVSEKARQIAPIKVVGTYGSEIVRHAVMFKPTPPPEDILSADLLSYVQCAKDTYASVRQAHPVTFAAFRQSPWYHHGVLALEQTQLTVRSPYLDNSFVSTVYRAPNSNNLEEDVRLRLISEGSPRLGRIPSDRGVGGASGPIAAAIARAFLEFTFKAEYAYDYGMPQWLALIDHILSPLRPERAFLGRHKFLHYRVWYRDALSGYVKEMLLDSRTLSRPYVNRRNVEVMVAGHLSGRRNYTAAIHKLLTLELLHRLFFDTN